MIKYILHGGYTRRDNKTNKQFYAELIRDVPEGGTLLLVYFASETDENTTESFEDLKRKIGKCAEGKKLNFELATKENFLDQFKRASCVFFNGGNTSLLLDVMRTFPDLRPLAEGKTIGGSSAGAYMLARYGTAHSEVHMREGLGFVPFRVICHDESLELPPSETSVAELLASHQNLELIRLKDCEWKVLSF